MNWQRSLFLIATVMMGLTVYDNASARGPEFRAVLNKWFVGRCHMDYCDRHRIISVHELGSHQGYGVLILLRSIDLDEEYDPKIGYEGKPVKVEKSIGSTLVFCSKIKPGVIFKDDNDQWLFRPLKPGEPEAEYGFNMSSYSWYYASCHNTVKQVDSNLAKRLGYQFNNGELEDDIKISKPTDVLHWSVQE